MSIFVVDVPSCAFILSRFLTWQRRYIIYNNGFLFFFNNRRFENNCVQLLKERGIFFQHFDLTD
jgi:hypothetical protein